eukprot:6454106-Alexandrium_andersonii.AAC.1
MLVSPAVHTALRTSRQGKSPSAKEDERARAPARVGTVKVVDASVCDVSPQATHGAFPSRFGETSCVVLLLLL